MLNSFEILKSINVKKDKDLIDNDNESEYVSYFINKALSFYPDTIIHANNMNMNFFIPKIMQYKYYVYGISKRNRYTPWIKFVPKKDLETIKKYYNITYTRAKEILPLIDKETLMKITEELKNRKHE